MGSCVTCGVLNAACDDPARCRHGHGVILPAVAGSSPALASRLGVSWQG